MNKIIDNNKILDCLKSAIDRRVFPGCALGWIAGGREGIVAAGRHTYDDGAAPVTERSLFDCASVTKAIPVSCLALWMVSRGTLKLDDRLIDFVPRYRGSFRDDIRLRHLLTHTLDFDFRLSECKAMPPDELLDAILNVRMKSAPGEKFCYANATSILLGMLLENVGGKPLHALAQETFFDPLEMRDTTFFPDAAKCVPTEMDAWRGRAVQGEVHDESAWVLRKIMTAGSAGLFSTVPDLLKFARMLLDGGTAFFSPAMAEAMHTNQIVYLGDSQNPHIAGLSAGLGWELDQEYMGTTRTPSTFGKTGFTGCAVILDRSRNAALAMLSNCAWPTRKPNRDLINEVRSRVADLALGGQ